MEAELEQARKKSQVEIQKTQQMRAEFNKLRSNYNSQVSDLRQKLDAENKRREAN